MSEIVPPFLSAFNPANGKPVFNGSYYFGLPDLDPTITGNQKTVRVVQENGDKIVVNQPIATNNAGGWTYNGSPVRLDIEGDYSVRILDANDAQVYKADRVSNPIPGSESFSGVVIPEKIELTTPGQLVVTFTQIDTQVSAFYLVTNISDRGYLSKDVDYTITGPQEITLTRSYNVGDFIEGLQNDPKGQLVPVNEDADALLVFTDLAAAQLAATNGNIEAGDTVTLNGNAAQGDGLGGDKYEVIATAFINDGVNYLDLNGTLQLALRENYYRFLNYSEVIGTANITAGTANVDLNQGLIQNLTLTESVNSFSITNFNPLPDYATTFTLRSIQDGVGGKSINWPGSFVFPAGAAPSVTTTANAVDEFVITTFDAGTSWRLTSVGQDIK